MATAVKPPVASILVVSYNVKPLLDRCLASIGEGAEIIVVDNASKDGSPDLVRDKHPRVRLVASNQNLGFGAACNRAAQMATSDVLLLLNPDTELTEAGMVERMRMSLESIPGASAVGFRQCDQHGMLQLGVGLEPSIAAELGRKLVQKRLDAGSWRTAHLLDLALGKKPRSIPWVAGSAMILWRSGFERVSGFDERFFLYFEDIDLCLRLGRQFGPVYYDPSITLIHHRGASAAGSKGLAGNAYRESQVYFWKKHRARWELKLIEAYLRLRSKHPRH